MESAIPFHIAAEVLIKLLPVKFSTNDDEPLVIVDGDMLFSTGKGLTGTTESEMVRLRSVTAVLKATGYLVHVSRELL